MYGESQKSLLMIFGFVSLNSLMMLYWRFFCSHFIDLINAEVVKKELYLSYLDMYLLYNGFSFDLREHKLK